MEASKDSEMSSEQAPESLPTEIKEEKPKSKMIWAVIIAVIIVVAAIGAAFGLGLFDGGEEEPTNIAPSAGARALTDTNIEIGGTVTLESTATDSDGTIASYMWWFGDGQNASGASLNKTTHTYANGGFYWVYHKVTDDKGANATNEAAMVRIYVRLYEVPATLSNTTAPQALLASDKDIVAQNTLVTFNMTGSIGVGNWHWVNETNHSEGMAWSKGIAYIDTMSLNFGDGSAPASVTPATYMTATHTYAASGHYAAKLNVTGTNGVFTVVMRTIHVLSPTVNPGNVKNPDSFTEATIGEPDYLDPAVDYETAGGEVLQSVYENLVWYDGSSAATLKAWLAKEVPTVANGLVSADGLNYTFNLKTGVKFHDGTNMTADDVVYSIQRVLRIHDPSGPGWMIDQIMTDYLGFSIGENVSYWGTSAPWLLAAVGSTDPAYVLTELDMKNASEAAILKVNETAVKFRLTHPYPGFLKIAAYTVMNVVSKDFVEAHDGVVGGEHNDYMDQHTCGTGPYKLVVWEVGAKVHMTRFDGYWGAKPDIKDIYIVKANDVNTRILMLQAGDADSIYLPIKYESTFAGKSDYRIVKGLPSFDLTFMAFNFNIDATTANSQYGGTITVDFFADIHMRKAFTHLLNYSQYIANVAMGNAIQPNGVIPKGMFGYDASVPVYDYNLTAAQAEFELAINPGTGNSWWDDGFTIPMFYNAGNLGRQTACEMVKLSLETLASPGGMTATVNALDWPTFLDQVYNTNGYMPVYAIGWGPDYADPDDYTNPMLASTGTYPYFTGYANATIDGLVMDAASELDDDVREDLYSQISVLVHDDCPYIWLTQPNNFHIERAWVQGYYYNPMFSGLWFPSYSK